MLMVEIDVPTVVELRGSGRCGWYRIKSPYAKEVFGTLARIVLSEEVLVCLTVRESAAFTLALKLKAVVRRTLGGKGVVYSIPIPPK
jgi:hypothetical protein